MAPVQLQFIAALSAGICITCACLFAIDLMKYLKYDDQVKGADVPEHLFDKLPIMIKLFLPFAPTFMPIAKSSIMMSQVRSTHALLQQSGFDQVISAEKFVAVRLFATAVGLALGLLLIAGGGMIQAIVLIFLLYIYPVAWLNRVKRMRHLEIQKALPNMLDLLTLSVEAGKDFLTAMRDILKRRKMDALGAEMKRTFQEITLGKSRRDALKDLVARVQLADLSNVMNAIIQADELGVSIGQILRIQGDQLRQKRFQRAEKLANEAPVKILFPMVLFIFPAVFIILLAPLFIQMLSGAA